MKVLHVITTLSSGGAEKMLVDIVEDMHEKHITIEVLVLSRQADFYSEKLRKLGVAVHYGKTDKIYHPSHIRTVQSFMKKGFDIIHTHLFAPQLYVALAKKVISMKVKLITTEHNTTNRRREKKYYKILDKFMYNQYDQIIAITNGTKNELSRYLPSIANRIVIIENGIKLNHYEEAKPLKRSDLIRDYQEGDIIILMVAAMREQKDHETVIRTSKLLPSNFHIAFVGVGERMEKVETFAEKNGSSRIHFLGRRSDVASIMKTCDIFVLSSHWEGFGLVVVEAMAAGLPVIASDVTGLKDVVGDSGLLFKSSDESELAEKVKKVMDLELLYNELVEKGIKRSNDFNIKKTVNQYLVVYQGALLGERNS